MPELHRARSVDVPIIEVPTEACPSNSCTRRSVAKPGRSSTMRLAGPSGAGGPSGLDGQLDQRGRWRCRAVCARGCRYWRAAGIDQHWAVVSADSAFFQVTKRIHNFLHGHPGDCGELGERERRVYERALAANAVRLARLIKTGDVVVLHDPQTAGLLPALKARGAIVVWRSHVGADRPKQR